MTTHHFRPDHFHHTLGTHPPVLRIADGDTVITSTVDARGYDADGRQVTAGGNPQTGPFYLEGAEPGDTLVLHLDRLTPNRRTGWSSTVLAANVVDPPFVRELPERDTAQWELNPDGARAELISPQTALGRLSLSLTPMLGCFGVAAADGQAISTATSAEHGGNMDYRGFVAGVTVYFPVFAPGALLFVGDGHALQGDGEIAGTGIETSFDIQLTVRLMKAKRIGWPRGENAEYIFTVGNARPLEGALQHATTEMARWLGEEYGLDAHATGILLGQCVEYDLGNVFDPAYTMVCKVPKNVLAGLRSGASAAI